MGGRVSEAADPRDAKPAVVPEAVTQPAEAVPEAVTQPAEAAAATVTTDALPLRRAANCVCPPASCTESFDDKAINMRRVLNASINMRRVLNASINMRRVLNASINMRRVLNASLEKSQLDLLILGKVSTVIMRDTTTVSRRRKAQTARTTTRCSYTQLHMKVIDVTLPLILNCYH